MTRFLHTAQRPVRPFIIIPPSQLELILGIWLEEATPSPRQAPSTSPNVVIESMILKNVRLWFATYALSYGFFLQLGGYLPTTLVWSIHIIAAILLTCSVCYVIPLFLHRFNPLVRFVAAFVAFGVLGFCLVMLPFYDPFYQRASIPELKHRQIARALEKIGFLVLGGWMLRSGFARFQAAKR